MSAMRRFQEIWELVLVQLPEKYSDATINLFFKPLEIAALNDQLAVLVCNSDIKADILNKRHLPFLKQAFSDIFSFPMDVCVLSSEHQTLDYDLLQSMLENGESLSPFMKGGHSSVSSMGDDYLKDHTTGADVSSSQYTNEEEIPSSTVSKERDAFQSPPASSFSSREPNRFSSSPFEHSAAEILPAQQKTTPSLHSFPHTVPSPASSEYTFDSFIVGNSNKFAHAACVAVANNPATAYNPLFIYGQTGLGKTHLLYAITNKIRLDNPGANIIYMKGEEFTNQLIASISNKTTVEFREKYRKADVLLIDDIQFIAGKESTQEEFFHTFNDLYEAHKQIILASDRPPKEIKTLTDRLRTRFEWGLLASIEPPDFELRTAIITKKAQILDIQIPPEVITYLAEKLKNSIRQLEGAVKKLGAYSSLNNLPITLDAAKECLSDIMTGTEPVNVTIDKIFSAVAEKYGVTVEEIKGVRRSKHITLPRHVSIYIMRTITNKSLPEIGKIFNRDHTTILASYETIKKMMRDDASIENDVSDLIQDITSK